MSCFARASVSYVIRRQYLGAMHSAHLQPCIDASRKAQAGGLASFQSNPEKLKSAVEFAAACGGFTCSKPGAIAAQPTLEEAHTLMKTAKAAV